ncbi:MAG: hypothetical protein HY658_04870 [Actinobacteria bacterium]|nr:hypothetical protein [Actinomycetota bacterium]
MTVAGTCFGFEVRSCIELNYLRSGGGTPLAVDVAEGEPPTPAGEPVLSWDPPEHPFRARLHRDGRRFVLWVGGSGWFAVDPDEGRIAVPSAEEPVRREERLWGIPALLSFLPRGDLPLHAAAVEVEGGALLLAGPRRFGKTTLAAGFVAGGHRLLGEDLACLRLGTDPAVVPGPAMLRLRHDVARRVAVPGSIVLSRDPERVHLALAPLGRGGCDPVPLLGVVLLGVGEGAPRLERVPPTDAISLLWPLSFRVPTDEDRARSFAGLAELSARVPVWDFRRRMTYEDLPAAVETLASIGSRARV